jgi:hypothetical protein
MTTFFFMRIAFPRVLPVTPVSKIIVAPEVPVLRFRKVRSPDGAAIPGNLARKPAFPGNPALRNLSRNSQQARCQRQSVDYLYSLYDALVSIHVPNDKSRAVVDAMERDMSTTIATKADVRILRSELHQECALIRKDMELLSTVMTVRLGSMLMFGLGLLFAALKLT